MSATRHTVRWWSSNFINVLWASESSYSVVQTLTKNLLIIGIVPSKSIKFYL